MEGNCSDYRISTMFLVSFMLFLLTIPGQLYEYYERNLIWYAILIGASLFLHIWWCAEMYWAGKCRCFHMLWVPGYLAVCALLAGIGFVGKLDMGGVVLLPVFIVMFLWQRMAGLWLEQSALTDSVALLVPMALLGISFFCGYRRGAGNRGQSTQNAEGEIKTEQH